MTGLELIIYILRNNLENEVIFDKYGVLQCFLTEEEAAAKFGVGARTIRIWYLLNKLKGIRLGDSLYFHKDITDPREGNEETEKISIISDTEKTC